MDLESIMLSEISQMKEDKTIGFHLYADIKRKEKEQTE